MSTPLTRALVLALPLLMPSLLSSPAHAATLGSSANLSHWSEASYSTTANDGLALIGASHDGFGFLNTLSLPFFEFQGKRYEVKDSDRLSAPVVTGAGDVVEVAAQYRIPVEGGTVEMTLYHRLADTDVTYDDISELSSRAVVSGPEGSYRFYWRIDTDLRGPGDDRVQLYQDLKGRGYWRAPSHETRFELSGVGEFGRFKVRLSDGETAASETRAWLGLPETGSAAVYVVRAGQGEFESHPGALLNNQPLQVVSHDELVPQPLAGSNQVLWYEASIQGRQFEVGPSLFAASISARTGVVEIDRMASTAFPPATVQHLGKTESLQSAFATGQVTISKIYYDGTIADKSRVNMSELDAIMEANVTLQSTQDTPTQWFSWFGVAKTLDIPGVLGVMYDVTGYSGDTSYREGAFALYDSIVDVMPQLESAGYPPQNLEEYFLWTVSHETGHAYNQHHEDFYYNDTSCFYSNTAIMGYSYDCANELFWDFGPNSDKALSSDPDDYVRPGHGVDFISSRPGPYPYNTTRSHRNGHVSTDQFSGGGCP